MVTGSPLTIMRRRRENSSLRYALSFLTTQSTLTTNALLIMLNMDRVLTACSTMVATLMLFTLRSHVVGCS